MRLEISKLVFEKLKEIDKNSSDSALASIQYLVLHTAPFADGEISWIDWESLPYNNEDLYLDLFCEIRFCDTIMSFKTFHNGDISTSELVEYSNPNLIDILDRWLTPYK